MPNAEHARELAEGVLLGAVLAAELARRAFGQRDARQAAIDVGRDRAEIATLVVGGQDHDRAQVLANQRGRRFDQFGVGDGADRGHAAAPRGAAARDTSIRSKRTASG